LLWAGVSRDPIVEKSLNVPIEFHHIPDNLEISSETIPQAELRLRGPSHQVNDLRPSDVHVTVDVSGAISGDRTFDLGARRAQVPRGVQIVQVIPSEVRISFDLRKTRVVQVRPRVVGTFATGTGMKITKVMVDPPEIAITGPGKRVDAVDAATTDPVDATGVAGERTFVTNAYVSDPLIQVEHPAPVHVTVV